jgi:preprotein translocase subunit SecA
MIKWILSKTFGTKNEREVKKLWPLVKEINRIEEEYQKLTEDELKAKTNEFKERIQKGETTDDIMPEAFAAVKNACRRLVGRTWDVCGHPITWDMIPFDVQLIGGMVLHRKKIAEMATGEGKTLVATMPLYLNALTGRNVHLVTVNDYLAKRDSQWMGKVYEFLGLTVGCLQDQMDPEEKKKAYGCNITYGTCSEFGFDYLRDNSMSFSKEEQAQKGHYYAIVDEVDSILIDEARTPLIISGPSTVTTSAYNELKPRVEDLFRKQTMLCNRLLAEGKALLEQNKEQEASVKLHLVQWGMPKNRQLLKMMEEPSVRRLLEKAELYYLSDMNRDERAKIKEDLFFVIEEKNHEVELTEKGRDSLNPKNPSEFVIPDIISAQQDIDADEKLDKVQKEIQKRATQTNYEKSAEKIHNLSQLLRAYCLFDKDVEYVVQDGKLMIVDEFTGRLMPGRRYSDGLHQALEAKEGVKIERETQTFATVTIQNYFRMYERLAGMTGTAETEANEFWHIYKLDVVVIPTNRPVRRFDLNDLIYKTRREKYNAIVEEVAELNKTGRPALIGTVSVEASEVLSRLLKRRGVAHSVLNAKYHEQEAEIVANAGQLGAVTIATNMAGRGTDIKLGKGIVKDPEHYRTNPSGLHVIGSERHEARRIDRQLRGRCARQGDPGSSRFYVSLEDDLMRLFGSDRIAGIMTRMGIEEGQELAHPLLNRAIESAQKKVEERNFMIRKHTLEYDDVMNKQRESIYGLRNELIHSENPKSIIFEIIGEVLDNKISNFKNTQESDIDAFLYWVNSTFFVNFHPQITEAETWDNEMWKNKIMELVENAYRLKEEYEEPESMKRLMRMVALGVIDRLWKEHLYAMDGLRESIGLRAYGQMDPLIEYKQEGYKMFMEMMGHINEDIASAVFSSSFSQDRLNEFMKIINPRFQHRVFGSGSFEGVTEFVKKEKEPIQSEIPQEEGSPMQGFTQEQSQRPVETIKRTTPKVGRNDPCPCGSGKKYKKCCGQ